MTIAFPTVPQRVDASTQFINTLSNVVRNIMLGKTNNKGAVTITASQATTVVSDVNATGESIILFMPITANASAEVGAGGMYISSRGKQTFTITHANNTQTDRNFEYIVVG